MAGGSPRLRRTPAGPSSQSPRRASALDRMSATASRLAASSPLLIGCSIVALLWIPGWVLLGTLDADQLTLNVLLTLAAARILLRNFKRRRAPP